MHASATSRMPSNGCSLGIERRCQHKVEMSAFLQSRDVRFGRSENGEGPDHEGAAAVRIRCFARSVILGLPQLGCGFRPIVNSQIGRS
jgi:hypothetical protein